MNNRKLNALLAGLMFLVAFATYRATIAPTTSFWDCGEFIASSYILGVPHPPGAPLYILVGHIFSRLPIAQDIGLRVNVISAILSAFTIMLTYLIIVRLLREWRGEPKNWEERAKLYAGGVIGALALAFSDSFWFNSVEAEVYAASMFFTAIVIWLILVWMERAANPASDKLLLLIAYLVGLAIGVHLLNILALPTVFMIIYFKRVELRLDTFFFLVLLGVLGFGAVYPGVVKGIPWLIETFSFWAVAVAVIGLVLLAYWAVRNERRATALALMSLFLVVLGYSTYAMIYIRSGLDPAIDENDPDTPARLVSYLNREQYGDIPLTVRRAPLWDYQIKKMYIRYFGWQFIGRPTATTYSLLDKTLLSIGIKPQTHFTVDRSGYKSDTIVFRGLYGLPFLLGLIGMAYHWSADRKRFLALLVLFLMTGLAIVVYLNQPDPQPRERDYAYVGSFFVFALWIGIGATAVIEAVVDGFRRESSLRKLGFVGIIALLFLLVPINMVSANYHEHDRTGNYVAYDYSYNILASCEPNAILFTNGDNDTFPLWFLQYVYGFRKDVRVVNLSLLNTRWYIRQLRDEEPKVPIQLTDAQIDAIAPQLWPEPRKMQIEVPKDIYEKYLQEPSNLDSTQLEVPENPRLVWELKPTYMGQALRVQDIMVVHILMANRFKRPIYFAVTVSPENKVGLDNPDRKPDLKNYLRMDGLVQKITPVGGPRVYLSPERLQTNLFEKYKYRGLNDPSVFLNDNIVGLLQNYRSGFLQLVQYYQRRGQKDKALAVLDKMSTVMPEDVVWLNNKQITYFVGQMYAELGRPEELDKRLMRILHHWENTPGEKLQIAQTYQFVLGNTTKAESLAQALIQEQPNFTPAYDYLVGLYARDRKYNQAVSLLEGYLQKFPGDEKYQDRLNRLKAAAAANQAATDSSKKTKKSDGTQ